MNLKQYAKSRKLTLKQLHNVCQVVLNEIPTTTLDDEQQVKLDEALAETAQKLAALPASKEEEITTQTPPEAEVEPAPLATSTKPDLTAGNRQVIDILGEDVLKRNVAIFMTHHIRTLQRVKDTHKAVLNKFEQDIYQQTGDTFARMTRNMESSFSDVERIANPQTEADEQAYQDYLKLVDDFLSNP